MGILRDLCVVPPHHAKIGATAEWPRLDFTHKQDSVSLDVADLLPSIGGVCPVRSRAVANAFLSLNPEDERHVFEDARGLRWRAAPRLRAIPGSFYVGCTEGCTEDYVLGTKEGNTCPGGYVRITDEKECFEDASKALPGGEGKFPKKTCPPKKNGIVPEPVANFDMAEDGCYASMADDKSGTLFFHKKEGKKPPEEGCPLEPAVEGEELTHRVVCKKLEYVLGRAGGNVCPPGTDLVKDENDCEHFVPKGLGADRFKLGEGEWKGAFDFAGGGCIAVTKGPESEMTEGEVYFSTDKARKTTAAQNRPICRIMW